MLDIIFVLYLKLAMTFMFIVIWVWIFKKNPTPLFYNESFGWYLSLLLDYKLKTKTLSDNIWSSLTIVFPGPNRMSKHGALSTNTGKEWSCDNLFW